MPKKLYFERVREYDTWVVIFSYNGNTYTKEFFTANSAVKGYRELRGVYGDNVRLAKVVLNYGDEI